eukprot:6459574-Amphidinium_carterae.3
MERQKTRLRRLRLKLRCTVSARHVYFAELVKKNHLKTLRNGWDGVTTRRSLMQFHGQYFKNLDREDKEGYERKALVARDERRERIAKDIALEEQRFDDMLAAQSTPAHDSTMVIRDCQFHDGRMQELQRIVDMKLHKPKLALELYKSSIHCPQPVQKQDMLDMVARYSGITPLAYETSAWGRRIAAQRDHMQNTVIVVARAGHVVEFYLFLFALKQPYQLFLLQLSPSELKDEPWVTYTFGEAWKRQGYDYTHVWTYEVGDYCSADVFDDVKPHEVAMIRHCICEGPQLLVSNGEYEAMEPWLDAAEEGQTRAVQGGQSSGHRKRKAPERTDENTLLHHLLTLGESTSASSSVGHAAAISTSVEHADASGYESGEQETESDTAEEGLTHVEWAELDAARTSMTFDTSNLELHFRDALLGGEWQKKRSHGRIIYGLRSDIKKNSPIFAFAERYALTKSASFDQDIYTEIGSALLARGWKLRMVQLWQHWRSAGEPVKYPPTGPPVLMLPDADREAWSRLHGKAGERTKQIESLLPKRGRAT